jgi:type IV pilus assembly protein PilQ
VNIIASSGVSGTVTMRLRSVPLDQVFLTILQSLQLGFELRGNVIRVAPQSVLAAEEGARAEARARAQRVQPLEVFLLPVNYASAGDLSSQVSGLLSPRGSVTVDSRTNTLIVKDLSENLGSIRMLIESLDAQVPQVLIEARIVETNDTFARQIGVQWGGDISFSQGNGNPTGLIFPSVLGVAGGATDGQTPTQGTSPNPNFAVNLPAPAGTGAGGAIGLTMGSVGGGVNLNLRLSAMEEAGHAKIVSSPRILTLDNTEATISQGTSIPISVVSAAGVQTVFVDATLDAFDLGCHPQYRVALSIPSERCRQVTVSAVVRRFKCAHFVIPSKTKSNIHRASASLSSPSKSGQRCLAAATIASFFELPLPVACFLIVPTGIPS